MPDLKTLLQKHTTSATFPEVVLIIADIIKKPKEFILAHQEYKLSFISYLRCLYLISRYRKGVPLAYITGHKEFFGLDFFVNRHTLIPRPDTELMVEETIKEIKKYGDKEITIIDVGTGSGCIPIAIMKTIKQKNIKIIATDISSGALRAAKKNALRHGVPITFLLGNLLMPIIKNIKLSISNPQPLVITANLPYGWSDWKNNSSVASPNLKFEPAQALFTGEHGLQLIRELLEQIAHNLSIFQSSNLTLFLEFDPRQTKLITDLIKNIFPAAPIEIKTDLAGRDRLVKIQL